MAHPSAPVPELPTSLTGWAGLISLGGFVVLVTVKVWSALKDLNGGGGQREELRELNGHLTDLRVLAERQLALQEDVLEMLRREDMARRLKAESA